MCLIALAHNVHDEFALVLAANRDEFFSRATAHAAWHGFRAGQLHALTDNQTPNQNRTPLNEWFCGQDLVAGGSWMAVSRTGQWVALTNIRTGLKDPAQQELADTGSALNTPPSRGRLVSAVMQTKQSLPLDASASALLSQVGPCNLLWGHSNALDSSAYFTRNIGAPTTLNLTPQIYGLSNGHLEIETAADSPMSWPKVRSLTAALKSTLQAKKLNVETLEAACFNALSNNTTYPDDSLPQTGVPIEWERLLSSAFIQSKGYGTRSSAVLTITRQGVARFTERTWLHGEQIDYVEHCANWAIAPAQSLQNL